MNYELKTKNVERKLNVGGLYQVNKNIWVMYASYNEAENGSISSIEPAAFSAFSSILNGDIRYLRPNERYVVLEDTNNIVKLLSEDGEVRFINLAREQHLNNSSFIKVR